MAVILRQRGPVHVLLEALEGEPHQEDLVRFRVEDVPEPMKLNDPRNVVILEQGLLLTLLILHSRIRLWRILRDVYDMTKLNRLWRKRR